MKGIGASLPLMLSTLVLGCQSPSDETATTTGISGYEAPYDDSIGDSTIATSTTAAPQTSTTGDPTHGLPSETTGTTDATTDPFTTGPDHDLSTDGTVGCANKLDILMVISRYADMEAHQPALLAAIPEFLTMIKTTLADFDIHLMVTNAEYEIWGVSSCFDLCTDNVGQGCEPFGPADYPCDAYAPGVLDACDEQFGAGATFPAAFGSANKRCPTKDGTRYISSADPNFDEAYTCLTDVGLNTSTGPRVATAMQYAITPELSKSCNDGFLRDDALLLVIMIDDEGSNSWEGGPDVWINALLEAKHGNPDAFVVLAITTDAGQVVSQCFPDDPGPGIDGPIIAFSKGIEHGLWGSCCTGDFVPFFADAADLVIDVCESFVPM